MSSLLLLTASLHPATAYSAPGDPPSGSPAGAVYQLPLQQGRSDAAPGGAGGTAAGGGGGGAGSLYRTENNFGSSSRVPGLAAGAAGAVGAAGAAGAAGAVGNSAGSGPGSGSSAAENGAGATPDGQGEGEALRAGAAADEGNTSVAAGFVLVAAIGLLAAGAGALSRRLP